MGCLFSPILKPKPQNVYKNLIDDSFVRGQNLNDHSNLNNTPRSEIKTIPYRRSHLEVSTHYKVSILDFEILKVLTNQLTSLQAFSGFRKRSSWKGCTRTKKRYR